MNKLQEPMNSEERYLYSINVRLDVLIHMMSSFLEVYAKQNSIATTSNEVKEQIPVQNATATIGEIKPIKEVKTKKTTKK